MDLGRRRLRGRQVLERFPDLRDATGRQGPVQPRPPDRDILGVTLQTGVEPPRRYVELALADRQVGLPQPDPVIIRGRPRGTLQEVTDHLDGGHPHAQDDVQPDQLDFDGLGRTTLAGPIQTLPIGFN